MESKSFMTERFLSRTKGLDRACLARSHPFCVSLALCKCRSNADTKLEGVEGPPHVSQPGHVYGRKTFTIAFGVPTEPNLSHLLKIDPHLHMSA